MLNGPKNNLQDVLSRRGQVPSTSSAASSSSTLPKTSKFKPATSTPLGRNPSAGSLPSFSTPGFVKPKAIAAVAPKRDIIDISSTETTPASPIRTSAAKRSSSEFAYTAEQTPSSKRVKTTAIPVADKENFSMSSPGASAPRNFLNKGKECEHQQLNSDYQPMELDPESNPFLRIDKDFPQHAFRHNRTGPEELSRDHSDLLTKSLDALKTLQCATSDYKFQTMEKIMEYVMKKNKNHDIVILNLVNGLYDERISAIRAVVAARERGEIPSLPSARLQIQARQSRIDVASHIEVDRITPIASPSLMINSSTLSLDLRPSTSHHVAGVNENNTGYTLASDDELWANMEDPFEVDCIAPDEPPVTDSASIVAPLPSSSQQLARTATFFMPNEDDDPTDTPFYPEIMSVLNNKFRLETFRSNQLEAINATMSGQDAFVLMPTGGGKSLCFQLPALCKTGKTRGVTIVVSPLLALMDNQVSILKSKNIDVVLWNSENSSDEAQLIRSRLVPNSGSKPAMLYVTPEKLSESDSIKNVLTRLYHAGELARFVIDEAHCISTWGQDFRDAYAKLDCIRQTYPTVPIMALTATANDNVIQNIINKLNIPRCVFLKQSFNRPNLHYEVRAKNKKTVLAEIANYIHTRHSNHTGIIYCWSRKNCEDVAKALRDDYGLSADHYHAGLTPPVKKKIQDAWQSGAVRIIVSTIAFGMGIDKADVRFVIHHTMPKSMDGYYQETGRAGRDGLNADCVLFYHYGDVKSQMDLVAKPRDDGTKPSVEDIQRLTDEIRVVMSFCTNVTRCRRVTILRYFSEVFEPANCHNQCDVCVSGGEVTTRDVTKEAVEVINLVKAMTGNFTMNHYKAVFMGSKKKDVTQKRHDTLPGHGKGVALGQKLSDQLFEELTTMNVLAEYSVSNQAGWSTSYLKLGPVANEVLSRQKQVTVSYKTESASIGPMKKATKGSAKRTVTRATSSRDKQPAVQEKPLSLYEGESISDDEEYSPYVAPVEEYEEDEILEDSNLKPGSRILSQSSTMKLPARNTLSIIDIEDESLSADPSEALFGQMKELRQQLLDNDGELHAEDVFDDMFLRLLSLTPPSDPMSFKALIKDQYGAHAAFVIEKWNRYGNPFLQACIGHNIAPSTMQHRIQVPAAGTTGRNNSPKMANTAMKTFKFKRK